MRNTFAVAFALALLACSAPAAAPEPTATPLPTATSAATAAPAALTFTVADGSKAVVSVREQLAGFSAPNDAVLTTTQVSGTFTVNPDGTFAAGSAITVGLNGLSSDSGIRDGYVKDSTLATRRFPNAVFVPKRATGLVLPLTAEQKFTIAGDMTIRGTTKEVTFDVIAQRTPTGISATATNTPVWTFADFGLAIPRVSSVLSIVDAIRLEVVLAATGPTA